MNAPHADAGKFPVGSCMVGNDGKRYQVNTTARSMRKWLPASNSADCIQATLTLVHVSFELHCVTSALAAIKSALHQCFKSPACLLYDVDIVLHMESMRYGVYGYVQLKDIPHFIKCVNDLLTQSPDIKSDSIKVTP